MNTYNTYTVAVTIPHVVMPELGPETWYISPSGPEPSIKDFIKLKWKQFRSK